VAFIDPTGQNKLFPETGNLPISGVFGNAVCTDDGGQPIFPCLIAPAGVVDSAAGLTLPGLPQQGVILVDVNYAIEAIDPTPLTIEVSFTAFDLCTSGAGNCPGADTPLTGEGASSVDLVQPDIMIDKTASLDPLEICAGVETEITYTYEVINIGDVDLENVDVTDDTCGSVVFVDGDTDGDSELDLDETWTYECTTTISSETTNTATVTATAVASDVLCDATDDDTLTITENPNPNVTADGASACPGGSADLCASANGGTPPYTIEWFNPGGGSIGSMSGLLDDEQFCLTVSTEGVYTAEATDANGCIGENPATFSFYPQPVIDVDQEVVDVCEGEDETFTATVTLGTPPYDVLWTDEGGNVVESCLGLGEGDICQFTTDVDGIYTATVTDANGCEASDDGELIVNPAKVVTVANPTGKICEGDTFQFCATVAGGTPPYTVEWFDPSGNLIETCNGVLEFGECCVTVSGAGTYTVLATDSVNCFDQTTAVLDVNQNLTVVGTPVDPEICAGDDQTICAEVSGGIPPYTVEWFDPSGTLIETCNDVPENGQCCVTVSGAGTYTAVATDSVDCEGDDTVTLGVNPNPVVQAFDGDACDGDSGQVCATVSGGTPPYTVEWRDAAGNTIDTCFNVPENVECCVTVSEAGEYCAFVTDAAGCEDDDCANFSLNPNPTCDVADAEVPCDGTPIQLCANPSGGALPYTFEWSTGETTECIFVSDPGDYTVTVIDDNDCVSDPCTATVTQEEAFTIGDFVWEDQDGDGCQGSTEPGIEGVVVELYDSCDLGNLVDATTTDASGEYFFDVCGGEYLIVVQAPVDYTETLPNEECVSGDPDASDESDSDCINGEICVLAVGPDLTNDCGLVVPGGGEGCTPGYWKQEHHFCHWPEPYEPDQLFSMWFDDAFPGKSLLTVLSQPGSSPPGPNQLNALGRHTIAALLNSASADVDYDLSPQAVIDLFNDVYPGSKPDYRDAKLLLVGFNEQICPLGNCNNNGNGNPADLDGDGVAGVGEFLILVENWGTAGDGDYNGNNVVEMGDLLFLLENWTP
jgi:hypothetical protein